MLSTLIVSALAMGLLVFWFAGRAAAETATVIGQRACARAGVQWLDQSVQFTGMRIVRDADGRLAIERAFRFEYSRHGEDRLRGRIVMLGERLRSLAGPAPAGPVGLDRPPT